MSTERSTGALEFGAASDTGRTRSENQDFVYAGPVPGDASWQLFAVADGVGGHARGEWASQRAVEVVAGALAELLSYLSPDEALEAALLTANETVKRDAIVIGASGAATTFVAALAKDGKAWWANVGDSRFYRLNAGRLEQVSDDHSWVAEQVREGKLSAEEARRDRRRNIVTRTIGFEEHVRVDSGGPISLGDGDALVLCSDGLHGPVEDAQIGGVVAELDPQYAVARLVELANEAGGPDNITVIVARPKKPSPPTARGTNSLEPVQRKWWILSIAAGVILVVGAGAAVASFLL